MKKTSIVPIENILEHNKRVMNKSKRSMLGNSLAESYYRSQGWVEAITYITKYYKLEEKKNA